MFKFLLSSFSRATYLEVVCVKPRFESNHFIAFFTIVGSKLMACL